MIYKYGDFRGSKKKKSEIGHLNSIAIPTPCPPTHKPVAREDICQCIVAPFLSPRSSRCTPVAGQTCPTSL